MKSQKTGLVSVIIPTYNRANRISSTLDSVFKQSYRPIEIIVVDDGSVDNTEFTINKWKNCYANDTDFSLIYVYQENQGAPAARNRGIQESHGDYIQFLDSDDVLCTNKLTNQIALMVNTPESEWAVGGVRLRDGNGLVQEVIPSDCNTKRDLLDDYIKEVKWFLPHIPLYKKSACEAIGPWHLDLKCLQDWEYGCRAIVRLSIPVVCKEVVGEYFYDERTDQITSIGKISEAFFESKCNAMYLVWEFLEKEKFIDSKVRKDFASRIIHTSRFHWEINKNKALELANWALKISNKNLDSIKLFILYISLVILGARYTNIVYDLLHKIKNKTCKL